MKIHNFSRCKIVINGALWFGIFLALAQCETFPPGIPLNRTGPVEVNDAADKLYAATPRIVGGQVSLPHSHPYIVQLLWRKKSSVFQCGGVILNEEWILTAAHCLYQAISVLVRAGRHDLAETEETEQEANGTHAIFDMFEPATFNDDIAFLKITPKLKFNEFVKPAVLVSANWNKLGMATVAGWGDQGASKSSGRELREVEVPIIETSQCQKWYKSAIIRDTNLCAGYEEGQKDSCQGDSGGPIFVKENGQEIVVGLVSWGEGCARPKQPGVYTRVSKYLDYIQKTTGYGGDAGDRISLSSYVGENLCKQYDLYLKEECLTVPTKDRPPSNIKCAWLDWKGKCDTKSCQPFSFADC